MYFRSHSWIKSRILIGQRSYVIVSHLRKHNIYRQMVTKFSTMSFFRAKNQTKAFFKVSQRFFPVLKWTTNSWRGIKNFFRLRQRESEEIPWTRPRKWQAKVQLNKTKKWQQQVLRSIVIHTEEEVTTFNRDVRLSVLSLGNLISFSFATKEVKVVNYFPSRANDLKFEKWC